MEQAAHLCDDANTLASWLARRDLDTLTRGDADVIVLCGSALLGTVDLACAALSAGVASCLLITGGIGHSTSLLVAALRAHPACAALQPSTPDGTSEAELLAAVATTVIGIDRDHIVLETASTNCGANAVETRRLLDALRDRGGGDNVGEAALAQLWQRATDATPFRMIIIQDPTMQRRSHASFERAFADRPVRILSFAPWVPRAVASDEAGLPLALLPPPRGVSLGDVEAWAPRRFVELLAGEIPRLRDAPGGYGPRGSGYIAHVDVPAAVELAHARIVKQTGSWR